MQGCSHAGMAELADAQDLGSCAARRAGSTPATRTSSSQASYRLRRAFSFHGKAHRALILLLLVSKPQPLRWVAVWVRRCAAVLSIIERISILAIPSTSEQALYRLLRLFSKVRACSRLKAGISLYTSLQICYISLIIDHNFTGSDAVSGGSPVQGRRSLTSTVCALWA